MPLTVETYYNIAEKRDRLRGIYDEYGENAVFIVPAGLDKDALLDLICGGTPYFGERPLVWTVGDLYKDCLLYTSRIREYPRRGLHAYRRQREG